MKPTKKLHECEPFNLIPSGEVKELEELSEEVVFSQGTIIFTSHSAPSGYLYFIRKGKVAISAETFDGVDTLIDSRTTGSFFGWSPIFTDEAYSGSAKAVEKTYCLLLERDSILKLAEKYPIISTFFNKAIYSQLRKLYCDMTSHKSLEPVAQMEAYPFQKKLYEIMSAPVVTCSPQTPVNEIAQTMTTLNISSIVVCDNNRKMIGIVTERDIVRKVLTQNFYNNFLTAENIMTQNPRYLTTDDYMYEAATYMLKHKIRHLPLLEKDSVAGMVTIQDLMRFRCQKSMLLVGSAKEAKTIEELAQIKGEIFKVAKILLAENRSHVETMEILSYIHHCIITRCFEIVFDSMQNDQVKAPDVKFAFIIMGSGGRKEMLLAPDQDNGVIFEDYPEHMQEEVDAFFLPFFDKLVLAFAEVGYPLCEGFVMVNNPEWRGTLSQWKKRVSDWIRVPEPKMVRYSSIFFDFMPVLGESKLCDELRETIHKEIQKNSLFLFHMLEIDSKSRVPLNLLGRFVTSTEKEHKGKLSIKENGSILIVDCSRMYTLQMGIHASTTLDRLELMEQKKLFSKPSIENLKAAFEAFTYLRLQNEIKLIEQSKQPSHYINPDELTEQETVILKEAFRATGRLQDSARRYFSRALGA